MMSSAIEALYIINQHNEPILEHTYRSRPASVHVVLPLYLAHSTPRPSPIYLPNINPPTVLFSLAHSNFFILSPTSRDVEPLFVLEFLHRLIDVLEEFLGAPLYSGKIESSYDVVAQLLSEMCDAGSVCNTESNALQDVVQIPSWMGKLLGGVGLPGSSPALLPSGGLKQHFNLNPVSSGPAIPWRRANVRHTSNELYVDIVETLSVVLAPSGQPLAAFANGSIAFTSKISGVPDLLLSLTVPGGRQAIDRTVELPVFHPCVRLSRWKDTPGELSFVPPDGKFMLAGYEVNLLPSSSASGLKSGNLNLPATIEISTSLGPNGSVFEARLMLSSSFAGASSSGPGLPRPGLNSRGSGRSTPVFGGGSSSSPSLQDVVVDIPIPPSVRNIIDLRASRGEAHFVPTENKVEWRIPSKDASTAGNATLRCNIIGPLSDDEAEGVTNGLRFGAASGDYNESEDAYQSHVEPAKVPPTKLIREQRNVQMVKQNEPLMPSSASVSFSVKGWLASGIRVDKLIIDPRKSRGLGEGVKPYKGVKYLTVSKNGVETRC